MIRTVLIIPLLFGQFAGYDTSELIDKLDNGLQKLQPQLNYSPCYKQYLSKQLVERCVFDKKLTNCPSGAPTPRIAWLYQCLADVLIKNNYQIPVHIICRNRNSTRALHMEEILRVAGFRYITFIPDEAMTDSVKRKYSTYFETIPNAPIANQSQINLCIEYIDATVRNKKRAKDECELHGSGGFIQKEIDIGMKHMHAHQQILQNSCNISTYISNATAPAMQYALILEDDQFIPNNALRLVLQVIIQNIHDPVGLFFLCDSYGYWGHLALPRHLQGTQFINSYLRDFSRTVGAVLISLQTLQTMYRNIPNNWIPNRRAIDHNFNYFIRNENILTHHVYPPIAGHGSHGLEIFAATRRRPRYCESCFENFYDVKTLEPRLQDIQLVKFPQQ